MPERVLVRTTKNMKETPRRPLYCNHFGWCLCGAISVLKEFQVDKKKRLFSDWCERCTLVFEDGQNRESRDLHMCRWLSVSPQMHGLSRDGKEPCSFIFFVSNIGSLYTFPSKRPLCFSWGFSSIDGCLTNIPCVPPKPSP